MSWLISGGGRSIKVHYLRIYKSGLISFNDQVSVYNMWEASVYDYNATRPNIIFTVNDSQLSNT